MVRQRRNNIILVKRDTPKRVTLPNGRTFLAKYKRVNRQCLAGGRTNQRTYRGRPVQGRRRAARPRARAKPGAAVRGHGFKCAFGKAFRLAKKIGKSKMFIRKSEKQKN